MSYPQYPQYKELQLDWFPPVPEHWRTLHLKWAIKFQRGHDLPSDIRTDGLVPVVSSAGVSGKHSVAKAKAPGIVTGRCGSIGLFYLIEQDYWPHNTTLYSIDLRGNEPRFLRYLLTHLSPLVLSNAVKAAVPAVDRNDIHPTPIALPDPCEQRAIADFLDRQTAGIDGLVGDYRRLIEVLSEEVRSLALSSVKWGTTKELRLANTTRIVSRPVVQREGELYTPLGLFNRGRGMFHKDPRSMNDMGDSDFFWIEGGDLIISGQFAWEGAIALAGKEESGCVVSHRYHVLRGRDGITLTEYLLALLATKHGDFLLNENSRGAAGRNRPLNINSLLKEKIPVPDLPAQEMVAKVVHRRIRVLSETSKQIGRLQEYRSALISAAVTGQIDVRSYRPPEAAALCQ